MDLEDLLTFDGLDAAERATGLSYKTDETTQAIGIATILCNNQAKEVALRSSGDTYFSLPWAGFVALVESHPLFPFTPIYRKAWRDGERDRDDGVWVNWKHGLLLFADRWSTGVNGGEVYGQSWGKGHPRGPFSSSCDKYDDAPDGKPYAVTWSRDVREGLFYWLTKMHLEYSPLPAWRGDPFVWVRGEHEGRMDHERFCRIFGDCPDALTRFGACAKD